MDSAWLRTLAKLRGLRGTAFDPFGYTAERRMERRLIAEYEELVDRVLQRLTCGNHGESVKLLELIDQVRGFGPVKQAAVDQYRQRVAAASIAAA